MTGNAKRSKTLVPTKTGCLAIVGAVAPLLTLAYPPAGDLLKQYPELACSLVSAVFGAVEFFKSRLA